jgi:hypothetical protein
MLIKGRMMMMLLSLLSSLSLSPLLPPSTAQLDGSTGSNLAGVVPAGWLVFCRAASVLVVSAHPTSLPTLSLSCHTEQSRQ